MPITQLVGFPSTAAFSAALAVIASPADALICVPARLRIVLLSRCFKFFGIAQSLCHTTKETGNQQSLEAMRFAYEGPYRKLDATSFSRNPEILFGPLMNKAGISHQNYLRRKS